MLILGVDTSTATTGLALEVDGRLVGERAELEIQGHSRRILPMLDELLTAHGRTLADLDLLAVAAGPGSFTGLRVGVATVNGLGWALAKPVLGVSSLHAFAELATTDEPPEGTGVVAVIDARRGQVFIARFRSGRDGLVRETDDRVLAPETAFAELVRSGDRVVGDGAARYRDELARLAPGCIIDDRAGAAAAAVARLSGRLQSAAAVPPAGWVEPAYLRRPHLFQHAAG